MGKNRPKNMDLPGMENRRLEDIHNKSIEYDAVKTERMRLTAKESELKGELVGLMEKYKKQDAGYHMEGVDVEYIPGQPTEATVKVKVHKMESENENSEVVQTQETGTASVQ